MENIEFNKNHIHDVAAFLFWSLVNKYDFNTTTELVKQSNAMCLFKQPFSSEILERYGYSTMPDAVKELLIDEINKEVLHHVYNEINMDGIFYLEDAEIGRSPSALHIDTNPIIQHTLSIHESNRKYIDTTGTLCIRTPLPSVVVATCAPNENTIKVANTHKALGKQIDLYLTNITSLQVSENSHLLSGIFYIPAANDQHADHWNKIVPNSICFLKGATFIGKKGFWGTAKKVEVTIQGSN